MARGKLGRIVGSVAVTRFFFSRDHCFVLFCCFTRELRVRKQELTELSARASVRRARYASAGERALL